MPTLGARSPLYSLRVEIGSREEVRQMNDQDIEILELGCIDLGEPSFCGVFCNPVIVQ